MCGIVGLFLKDASLERELGGLLAGMLATLCDRGPDSAGFAVYGDATPESMKLTLRAPADYDFKPLLKQLENASGPLPHVIRDTHIVITVPLAREQAFVAACAKGAQSRFQREWALPFRQNGPLDPV